MPLIFPLTFAPLAQVFLSAQVFTPPGYFEIVVLSLLGLGAVGWLIAAALGFTRARAFGASARWFAFSALCLVIYHLQFLVLAVVSYNNPDFALSFGAFFNLFVLIAALCAIIGFQRLSDPK